MSDFYLGEIRMFPFSLIPRGWAACQGQLLPIAQNAALFALLGTTFGGNGSATFALPDLRGRTPYGTAPTLPQGTPGGSETATVSVSQLPPHTHNVLVNSGAGTAALDTGNFLATNTTNPGPGAAAFNAYAPLTNAGAVPLHPSSVTPIGSNAPHENRQPSLVMAYCIAMTGIFPSRP